MARPMPVLPEVPSMIVPPGFSRPARSASSIILTAIRSLIELPGLKVSILASTVPFTTPFVIRLRRTIGVPPIASRMSAQIFFTIKVYTAWLMPRLIAAPAVVAAAGTKPKRIEEFAGRVNSGHPGVSVARMVSPPGWTEPGQRPDFEEITGLLRGMLRVGHEQGVLRVHAGPAVVTPAR